MPTDSNFWLKQFNEAKKRKRMRQFNFAVANIKRDQLFPVLSSLVPLCRNVNVVFMRAALIKILRDKYNLSFSEIGSLLHRHHTSVLHLYYAADDILANKNKVKKNEISENENKEGN
jgi:hypothetical protein